MPATILASHEFELDEQVDEHELEEEENDRVDEFGTNPAQKGGDAVLPDENGLLLNNEHALVLLASL
jgi:hypothetical protein